MMVKRWLYGLLGALLLLALPDLARIAFAHAVLVRAEPAANAQLTEAPHEIRLWFTEPLEPAYSTIELRDATGATVSTLPSYVEPTDDHQLVLMTEALADGLYTVIWRNVSSADGHQQTGSYAFIIGTASNVVAAASSASVGLSLLDVLARWVNFWGLALAVGSVAFVLFVWQPAMRPGQRAASHNDDIADSADMADGSFTGSISARPLWTMNWLGWAAAGIGATLLLLNQTAILLDQQLVEVVEWNKIAGVVNTTRFGALWLWRMGLWLLMGVLLLVAARLPWAAWLALICGLAMLLPVSMHSHAAVSSDLALSIFSDWVHLAMTALWVGGLVQFLVAIGALLTARQSLLQPVATRLGTMVAHFSNFARAAVAGLIITGIYATWHQVNSLEALFGTLYGQLLSLKLLLALVLLVVAAINLVATQRRLLAGQEVWAGRLRALVAVETLLALAILLVVGGMTSINPARNEMAQRAAVAAIPPAPAPQPIHMTEDVDDLQIHFTATPGWVGNSNFVVQLVNRDGEPIPDASLIRMRFEHATENLGESELQIRPEGEAADGIYTAEGANLSAVGDWTLRLTVQRPDEFDTIADFDFNVIAPPPPPPMPVVEQEPTMRYRTPTFLLAGVLALLAGFYSLIEQRFRLWHGASLVGLLLVILGALFVVNGLMT